jgi:hypothetical protein
VDVVNLGAVSSKIDGIQALGGAFSLVFAIKASFGAKPISARLKRKVMENLFNLGTLVKFWALR